MSIKKIIKVLIYIVFSVSMYFLLVSTFEFLSYLDWDRWSKENAYFIFAAAITGWVIYESRPQKNKEEHSQ